MKFENVIRYFEENKAAHFEKLLAENERKREERRKKEAEKEDAK